MAPSMLSNEHIRLAVVGGTVEALLLILAITGHAHTTARMPKGSSRFLISLYLPDPVADGSTDNGASDDDDIIFLGKHAVEVLKRLELDRSFWSIAALHSDFPDKRHVWLQLRTVNALIGEISSWPHGIAASTTTRAFRALLYSLLPPSVTVHTKQLARYSTPGADAIVDLYFEDGSTDTCDILIGACGIHSPVLQCTFPNVVPRDSGIIMYTASVETSTLRKIVGDEKAVLPQLYVSLNRAFITLPGPNPNKTSVYLYVNGLQPDSEEECTPESEPQTSSATDLAGFVADWSEELYKIALFTTNVKVRSLYELPELPSYTSGRVTLIGDDAHRMLPLHQAGPGAGIEDAYILSQVLLSGAMNPLTKIEVLKTYTFVRHPRTSKVHRFSREARDLLFLKDIDPNDPKELEQLLRRLQARYSWIFDWNIGEDALWAVRELVRDNTVDKNSNGGILGAGSLSSIAEEMKVLSSTGLGHAERHRDHVFNM
ncbi:hypothetical protein SISNIDRAFT_508493 [Sistotremastrum niveocremeum HHB9708]|uniref:FAD-binding domain-containing protein n=1 Tax=Sistotremastrum niveocremeum HHB9708 TaxID=1314777 RepID=A0A164U7E8_9AGAM|nr:hypothetical protein SISNIDRAFT_508493 [Sistotremastrum niveocremeum HHB9708]